MRLRADLTDNAEQRTKLHADLDTMQALVEEGIAYAQSAHSTTEAPCRVDLEALLDSMVCDYIDVGKNILLYCNAGLAITTRPHALRRIMSNLIDNALKYGTAVEIMVEPLSSNKLSITISDNGSGIPEAELEAVLRPFYRIEESRNRDTGGTGLGLAIAHQLIMALGGTLSLRNRIEGGLEAQVLLPVT